MVSHVRAAGVSVLIDHPLELRCVGVAGPYVLWLQVLQLAVDVVSLAHSRKL